MTLLRNTVTEPDGSPLNGWLDVAIIGNPFQPATQTEVLGPIKNQQITGGAWSVDLAPGLYAVTQRRRDGAFHSRWTVEVPDSATAVWLADCLVTVPGTPASVLLRAVTSATVDAAGHLQVTYSDGSAVDAGPVIGPQGPPWTGSATEFGQAIADEVDDETSPANASLRAASVSAVKAAITAGDIVAGLTAEQIAVDPTVRAASVAAVGGLDVTNLAGLTRWGAARGGLLTSPPVVTVVGDSIAWGVGTDGTSSETTGPYNAAQQSLYRERAWPVQLRKMLNARFGLPDAQGWVGLTPGWQSGAVLSGGALSQSVGPFGYYNGSGGTGGYNLNNGASVTLPAASSSLGKFTDIDVYYWGSDSGVAAAGVPTVTIDGVAQALPATTTGWLNKISVTGLADTTHDVVIGAPPDTTKSGWVSGVTVRRGGVVVNRIARPGATSTDVLGAASTAPGRSRARISTVMPGTTNLLVLGLGTNDQSQQVPLATFTANLQELIAEQVASGGCVLLLGSPPASGPTGALTEQAYRDAMRDIAAAAQHVAYTDARQLWGTHANGYALGLTPTSSTVHPSARGAGVIAAALAELLTLPRYA